MIACSVWQHVPVPDASVHSILECRPRVTCSRHLGKLPPHCMVHRNGAFRGICRWLADDDFIHSLGCVDITVAVDGCIWLVGSAIVHSFVAIVGCIWLVRSIAIHCSVAVVGCTVGGALCDGYINEVVRCSDVCMCMCVCVWGGK